jgi:hypothetical protein
LNQAAITVWNSFVDDNEGFVVQVGRHGSVAIGVSLELVPSGLDAVARETEMLRRAWQAACTVLGAFATGGPVHTRLLLSHPNRGGTTIARWTTMVGPWDDDLEAIRREARRTLGRPDWEP